MLLSCCGSLGCEGDSEVYAMAAADAAVKTAAAVRRRREMLLSGSWEAAPADLLSSLVAQPGIASSGEGVTSSTEVNLRHGIDLEHEASRALLTGEGHNIMDCSCPKLS